MAAHASQSRQQRGRRRSCWRPDCVAGHIRFELRNVVAKYPFERSHRFPLISRIPAAEANATADPGFVALVLENLRAARTVEADQRRIELAPTASFPKDVLVAIEDVRAVDTEQSNTTVLVGTDYVVKFFRRLEPGLNPEIEVGHFLTETVAFPHAPPCLELSSWRKTELAVPSPSCMASCKTRATPGP